MVLHNAAARTGLLPTGRSRTPSLCVPFRERFCGPRPRFLRAKGRNRGAVPPYPKYIDMPDNASIPSGGLDPMKIHVHCLGRRGSRAPRSRQSAPLLHTRRKPRSAERRCARHIRPGGPKLTNTIRTTAVFLQPFQLASFNDTLPAGEYRIETVLPDPVTASGRTIGWPLCRSTSKRARRIPD